MALYSILVEHEGESFSTQLTADSVELAVHQFFSSPVATSTTPHLSNQHLLYVTPMEGLTNAWAACAGHDGHYVSLTCFRTEQAQNV
jgi:hypothetical protein